MKRSERHHLKENAFAVAITSLQQQFQEWGRGLIMGIAVGLCVLVLFGIYSWWSERTATQAGMLLADALVLADAAVVPPTPPATAEAAETTADNDTVDRDEATDTVTSTTVSEPVEFVQPPGTYPTIEAKMSAALPKLIEAADTYPDTQPGVTARYRAAAALAVLGRYDQAADQYRQVISRDENGVYGRMATLGLATVQIARGAYDEAIALLEQSSGSDLGADLPIDGVLMRLGEAYALSGRSGDARATFQRVMDEFPASFYFADAEREIQVLQTEG